MPDRLLNQKAWRQRLLEAGSSSELRAHAEEIAQQSREHWDRMQRVHGAMRTVSETVVSPKREVSVTVVWGGAVTGVKFPTAAYKRLPAAELANLVQTTIAAAQKKVTDSASALLAPTLPDGVDVAALLSGEADLTELIPANTGSWFAGSGDGPHGAEATR